MKAIVTGTTGGLGRNLVQFLKNKGWDVLALGRKQHIGDQLGVRFIAFDLSDAQATLHAFEYADVVFHCAALSSPWGSYQSFYVANVVATQHVLAAIEHYDIPKLVHVSSPSIYFDYQAHEMIHERFVAKSFVNHYARTKYEAEQCVLKSHCEVMIIRPRGIFGEYDQALLPRFERIMKKGFLPLIKGREVILDISYVGNVVHALYLAATTSLNRPMIFNISNDEPLPIQTIYRKIMHALDHDVPIKTIPYAYLMGLASFLEIVAHCKLSQEPMLTRYGVGMLSASYTLDLSAAKEHLNYQAIYSIDEGLHRYANWKNQSL